MGKLQGNMSNGAALPGLNSLTNNMVKMLHKISWEELLVKFAE